MTGREDEAEEVIADVVVEGRIEIRQGPGLPHLERPAELFLLAFKPLVATVEFDRPPLAGGHEPRAGLFGTPASGHCSSAATSASWARSSATPTSRTSRARLAMSRGDSIRQTASIAR